MKLGIMQPYLFPYIGYFQLIQTVDQFLVYDDVKWIKSGWINRNRILLHGNPHYFTLPLRKGSASLNINQRFLSENIEEQKKRIMRQITEGYQKAPLFDTVFPLITECLSCEERNASAFIVNALRVCCAYLGINTPFVLSSELDKQNDLQGQDKILDMNKLMGATSYINPIGGIELYDKARFAEQGLELSFIKTRNVEYDQRSKQDYVPFLSIIDVMMFNTQSEVMDMLKEYDLH